MNDEEMTDEEIDQFLDSLDCGTEGLDQMPDLPSLRLNQEVNVISGPHAGKKGKAYAARDEGKSFRLTLFDDEGNFLYVNTEEIDFKFETVDIILVLPEDERAGWLARIEQLKDNIYYE